MASDEVFLHKRPVLLRTYRYYTCYGRGRYGGAGCMGVRIAADAADEAVLQALYDFYSVAEPVLAKAVAAAQREFHDRHADRHAGIDAVTAQITATQAKIDRYHTAFENETMDDATAGPRIKQLRHELAQLQARRDDLADALDRQPEPPAPSTLIVFAPTSLTPSLPAPVVNANEPSRPSSTKSASPTRESSRLQDPRWRNDIDDQTTPRHQRFAQWCGWWSRGDSNP